VTSKKRKYRSLGHLTREEREARRRYENYVACSPTTAGVAGWT
jgi:hypothetical protein